MVWGGRGLMSVLVVLLVALIGAACGDDVQVPTDTMKPQDAGFISFDGGTDAGPVDLGTVDTGIGPTDTGVVDSGNGDSGVIDSGLDAGIVDLGVDAGPADTGVFNPGPSAPGDVVISEVMQNPNVLNDTVGEWIELYNATSQDLSLFGCVLSDLGTDGHTINEDVVVAAGGYVSLARSPDPGFVPDYVYSSFLLTNDTDEVIVTCDGVEIDRIIYDNGATFPDPTGASMNLDVQTLTSTSNDDGANWCESTTDYNGDFGTPGAENIDCP